MSKTDTKTGAPGLDAILERMSKSAADYALNWYNDPSWDLSDTAAEDHPDEQPLLAEFEKAANKWFEDRRLAQRDVLLNDLIRKFPSLDHTGADALAESESAADYYKKDAEKLLLHYMDLAGVAQDMDNRSEIREMLESTIKAAVQAAKAAVIPMFVHSHMIGEMMEVVAKAAAESATVQLDIQTRKREMAQSARIAELELRLVTLELAAADESKDAGIQPGGF